MFANKRKKKSFNFVLNRSRSISSPLTRTSLNLLRQPRFSSYRGRTNTLVTKTPLLSVGFHLNRTSKRPTNLAIPSINIKQTNSINSFNPTEQIKPTNLSKLSKLSRTSRTFKTLPMIITSRERSPSLSSNFSARSRSRTISPVFPSSHFRKSKNPHRTLDLSKVWDSYKINDEISYLAAHFLNSGRKLPLIDIPINFKGNSLWPKNIPLYFITIKPERQQAFLQRYKGPNAIVWNGSNGKATDIGKLTREGRLVNNNLKRGEIGCYLSHYRLWEKIVTDQNPLTIICEDDVNLIGTGLQAEYFNQLLTEIQNSSYDILFLSWFRYDGGVFDTSHTKTQWTFCQLWAYVITLEGAKKLLADHHVRNMHEPVDVALFSACCRKTIRNLVAYPPLCLTVGSYSDTCNLR